MSHDPSEDAQPMPQQAPAGPARLMSRQMSTSYANCAMVATSPRDVSLYFGRYVPTTDDKGAQQLAELYETQIYMTVEQAEDLARILTATVQNLKARKAVAQ